MTRVKLPQGARFELARLVSINKITTDQLTKEGIEAMKGPNAEAIHEIERVYLNAGHQKDNSQLDRAFAKEIAVNVRPSYLFYFYSSEFQMNTVAVVRT